MRELEGPREAANRTAGAKNPQQTKRGTSEPPANVARDRAQRPAAQLHAAFTLL